MKAAQGKHRGLKAASCICFLLIFVALLLIDRYSPATGYELSIYESLPATMWFCLFAALAGGTGIVVHQAFAERKSRYWLLGFFVLIFGISIILLLPIIRGYYLYGAMDTISHTRWASDIVVDGHFRRVNQYPITHILMAQLAEVCGAPPEAIAQITAVLFTVVFMLFSYLLASSVMPRKGQALLSAAATALFFNYYHVCVYPQAMSIMALPLVFYLYFKGFEKGSLPFRIAFVIVLLLFPYFHPAPAAALIACLLGAELAKVMWRVRRAAISSPANELVDRITFEPTLISSIAFLTWISSFGIFTRTIWNTLGWLTGEIESLPRVMEVEDLFQRQGLGVAQQIVLALKLYGDNFIFLALSSIALLIIAWRFLHRQDEVRNLSILSMPFVVSGPIWVLIFAATLLVTLGRLLGANIMMWATPVFAAFALFEIFGRWKKAGAVVITGVLLSASVLGVLGVYHSPYTLQTNWQITRQDADGSEWFKDHVRLPFSRGFVSLGVASLLPGRLTVPEHFGYADHETLGEAVELPVELDIFVLLTEGFKLSTTDASLPPTMISPWAALRFTHTDFQHLEQDPSVSKLYSNGEFDVFNVSAQGEG